MLRACIKLIALLACLIIGTAYQSANAGTIEIGNTGMPGSNYVFSFNNSSVWTPAVTVEQQYTAGPWVDNIDNLVKWIAPSANQIWDPPNNIGGDLPGLYTYKIEFFLPTWFDPTKNSATIEGLWATDNGGLLKLNGDIKSTLGPETFGKLNPFTITSGFKEGLNTMTFEVTNDGYPGPLDKNINPTGLIVEFTKTSVPEPSLILLLGLGIGTACAASWKFRS